MALCFGNQTPFSSTWHRSNATAGCGPPIRRIRRTFCAGSRGKAHIGTPSPSGSAFEKSSKAVLGLGLPDAAFIARGEQNFARFAAVLDASLKGKTWLVGERLTIADFSVGGLVPSAERFGLPVKDFPDIVRWYRGLAALPAWREALTARNTALAAWQAKGHLATARSSSG